MKYLVQRTVVYEAVVEADDEDAALDYAIGLHPYDMYEVDATDQVYPA